MHNHACSTLRTDKVAADSVATHQALTPTHPPTHPPPRPPARPPTCLPFSPTSSTHPPARSPAHPPTAHPQVTSSIREQLVGQRVQHRLVVSGSGDWRFMDLVPAQAGKLQVGKRGCERGGGGRGGVGWVEAIWELQPSQLPSCTGGGTAWRALGSVLCLAASLCQFCLPVADSGAAGSCCHQLRARQSPPP